MKTRHSNRFCLSLIAILACCGDGFGETVTVYRDTFGIPHIYADTVEAGLYANGWTQAEDRLQEMLKNFLRGTGEYSAAFGAGENGADFRADRETRMWDHYGVARRNYGVLSEELRGHLKAFTRGVNDYMAAHPNEVPEWWGDRQTDVYMPVAFSRQFIWGWPAGQARSELKKIGLEPNYDVDFRSSNEMAISPSRSAVGAAMLVIDPHLGWFGRQRYWEMRLHAGDMHLSGFATAGFPYVNLGHTEHVAWAHTTGGPDTADVYELTLDADNPRRYSFDGSHRELTNKAVEITVKGEVEPRQVTFWFSHYGPIIARKGDKAYSAKLAYEEEVGYLESKYLFAIAKDYKDVITALEVRQIMPQNVMVADTKGNIYYQRTGRVPIRPAGYDFSRPVDGSIKQTDWLGIHPTRDLMQVLNPPQGYMQNCNIPPDVMMVDSPLQPEKYRSYLFNQRSDWTHQRAARCTELLAADESVTVDELIEYALDRRCYQHERWVAALDAAHVKFGRDRSADYEQGLRGILKWDGDSDRDSGGALKYYYWRHELAERLGEEQTRALAAKVEDLLVQFNGPRREGPSLTADEHELLVDALEQGMRTMRENHDSLDAVFGDVFRVGRLDGSDDVSWPVGGGSLRLEGIATVRAAGFTNAREDHTRWGRSGQTSTQVVVLTKPIQSFTQPPIGQSDRPDSPHYRDQARDLFSKARMKPSWFNKNELLDGNVRSQYELKYSREQ